MITVEEVHDALLRLFNSESTFEQFQDWIVSNSWNMHKDSTKEAQELVASIELALSENYGLDPGEAEAMFHLGVILDGLDRARREKFQR